VKDLAEHFADGRLSSEKLIEADDAELSRLLIAIRGIGQASVSELCGPSN
jgi:DNA-3-methyladenine glycosylase II